MLVSLDRFRNEVSYEFTATCCKKIGFPGGTVGSRADNVPSSEFHSSDESDFLLIMHCSHLGPRPLVEVSLTMSILSIRR